MALGASQRLHDGVAAVETMTRFALAVLALASGVYTYLGVRSILDGSPTSVFFAAIIYSASVSVGIYAFWSYMARFYPHVTNHTGRAAMLGVMALGAAMIIAMSSWLNAAALAGSAALEQHLAETVEDYTADLDQAHQNALAAQSLLPDIQRASERFAQLAASERQSGALTGTTGSGSVVQLLSQMSAQMKDLENGINASREQVAMLFNQGQKRLETMRTLVSAPGAVAPRADQFSSEVVALTGVITSLGQTSIAPSIRRAADDLSLGFIAPVADGGDADLVNRQDRVMETVRASVATQSKVLSEAADEILARAPVAERRFVPLSSAEAVLRYATDFIPAWAGAISIDLLPGVLVFILAAVHSAIRKQEEKLPFAERITAAELLQALEVQRAVTANGGQLGDIVAQAEAEEPNNITSLDPRTRAKDRTHEDR
ncbi:hypothetical protein HR059_18265 (plasmid) [Sinorhizobium meliloti WSM1022]|jgi:hypothetical protein|uniref:DUF4407 domain-containing protein n=2 Tax=Rhizobium meliloti TaxID=382 RepID=Q92WJ4_RHIME|nr:hypothetical protein [Sinorhizobium meliloti]AEH84086.1 hypothetical protein SM11_pD1254 [Sinorhizobium meliloti SM11]AGG71345.1 Hypothetical protein SM2011_b20359 [Sinorhizobium meliloti 2011]ASP56532.1 hypothetical protein CDO31_33065 [Sinorhizobium meliloti]ASP63035.1 hypothetical protein CDO30_27230 [Sinorhizobium meliloti]ASP82882.1 hypothetical protein CDO27_28875 [Sinorhizobium meliloti]